MKIRKSNSRR